MPHATPGTNAGTTAKHPAMKRLHGRLRLLLTRLGEGPMDAPAIARFFGCSLTSAHRYINILVDAAAVESVARHSAAPGKARTYQARGMPPFLADERGDEPHPGGHADELPNTLGQPGATETPLPDGGYGSPKPRNRIRDPLVAAFFGGSWKV